jgi:hypothetical protein
MALAFRRVNPSDRLGIRFILYEGYWNFLAQPTDSGEPHQLHAATIKPEFARDARR